MEYVPVYVLVRLLVIRFIIAWLGDVFVHLIHQVPVEQFQQVIPVGVLLQNVHYSNRQSQVAQLYIYSILMVENITVYQVEAVIDAGQLHGQPCQMHNRRFLWILI